MVRVCDVGDAAEAESELDNEFEFEAEADGTDEIGKGDGLVIKDNKEDADEAVSVADDESSWELLDVNEAEADTCKDALLNKDNVDKCDGDGSGCAARLSFSHSPSRTK